MLLQAIGPKSFPWGYPENQAACVKWKKPLKALISCMVKNRVTEFRSGMAEDTDMWAPQAQELYRPVLNKADSIVYVHRDFSPDCMLERNRFMVNHAGILIAIYNGEWRGGIAATVGYAGKMGKKIYILNPATGEVSQDERK